MYANQLENVSISLTSEHAYHRSPAHIGYLLPYLQLLDVMGTQGGYLISKEYRENDA
jgi:hypothetical protein